MLKSETRFKVASSVPIMETCEHGLRPYRWVMLLLLWLLYFSHGIVSRSAAPLVTPMMNDLNMLYGQMGLVLGSWQLTYIATAIFAGILIDRWGLRKALFVGIVVIGLSVLLRYFVIGFGSLLFAVALFGVGGPMISIGAPKAISVWFGGKGRGTAVGIYSTGSRIGQILALAATNGVVMPLSGYSWRMTFAYYGFFVMGVALIWWGVAKDTPSVTGTNRLTIYRVLANLIKVHNVRLILIAGLLNFSIIHGFMNWLPKLLETRGMSPPLAGYGSAIPLVAGVPSVILVPGLIPMHLRARAVALLSVVAAAAIMMVATSLFPLLVGLLLFGITVPPMLPIFMLILMELPEVGAEHMGTAAGMYFCVAEIGGFLGPFIVGALFDFSGTFLSGSTFLSFMSVAVLVVILMQESVPATVSKPGFDDHYT